VIHQHFQPEWLESFLAVADTGSFSEAASRLHRSQPRVSTHVAQLEAAIRQSLFDRRRRPVTLTDAGVIMAVHARRVLQALDEAADAFGDATGAIRGTVTLGTHPSISAGYMPGLLSRLKRSAPGVAIELTEKTTTQLVESLRQGTIDLAIRSLTLESEGSTLAYVPLWRERLTAVFPAARGVGERGEPLSPHELDGKDLIVIARPGASIDPEFAAAFARWGISPRIAGRTEEPQTLINLVRAGLGVGVLNELALDAFSSSGIVGRPITEGGDGRVVALCWNAAGYLTRAARAVAHAVLTHPAPTHATPLGPVSEAMLGRRPDVDALMNLAETTTDSRP